MYKVYALVLAIYIYIFICLNFYFIYLFCIYIKLVFCFDYIACDNVGLLYINSYKLAKTFFTPVLTDPLIEHSTFSLFKQKDL